MSAKDLIPTLSRPPEERHRIAVKAGIASGKVRREKGIAIKAAQLALKLCPKLTKTNKQELIDSGVINPNDKLTVLTVAFANLAMAAAKGDTKALTSLIEFAGESYSAHQKDTEIDIKKRTLDANIKQSEDEPQDTEINLHIVVDKVPDKASDKYEK
jgi:hypothetical protein